MRGHPTLEAELSHAIARGVIDQTSADVCVLARYKDAARGAGGVEVLD